MNFQMIATITCIENGKSVYTMKLENLLDYDFIWDSKKLTTLHLVTSNLDINDLNTIIAKPYDSYILIGVKKVFQDGQEKTYDIPARVFKHLVIKGDYNTTDLTFYETWENETNDSNNK